MASLTTTTTNPLPPPVSADYYDLEFATAVNDLEPDEMSDEEKENVEQLREKIHEGWWPNWNFNAIYKTDADVSIKDLLVRKRSSQG